MARRLDRTARRLGLTEDDRAYLIRCFRAAMEPRRARIEHDHDPDYLHPARTALILMDDTGARDPSVLSTALTLETRSPRFALDGAQLDRLGRGLTERVERIGGISGEESRRLEELLALPPPLAAVAAAERLDHARHLHLRDRGEWEGYHALTCAAYTPVAERVDSRLGQRLAWWCRTFRERFLHS